MTSFNCLPFCLNLETYYICIVEAATEITLYSHSWVKATVLFFAVYICAVSTTELDMKEKDKCSYTRSCDQGLVSELQGKHPLLVMTKYVYHPTRLDIPHPKGRQDTLFPEHNYK